MQGSVGIRKASGGLTSNAPLVGVAEKKEPTEPKQASVSRNACDESKDMRVRRVEGLRRRK